MNNKITSVVRQQPKLTGQIGNTLIYVNPDLEDQKVDIIKNGLYTLRANEGFDGLNSVEINADVQPALPEKGVIFSDYDSNGYPTKVTITGYDREIPGYILQNSSSQVFSALQNIQEIVVLGEPTSIGHGAFYYNRNLKNIILPDTIQSLGANVFYNNQNLELDHLPASLSGTLNQNSIFQNCYKLKIKTIPDGVTYMGGSNLFANCTGLTQISVRNVAHFSSNDYTTVACFQKCTGLKAAWIGPAITSNGFGRYTFIGCTGMRKLFIDKPRATVESFKNYPHAFSNSTFSTDIIVCNDDEGFMTKEEFDAIDWSTYEG